MFREQTIADRELPDLLRLSYTQNNLLRRTLIRLQNGEKGVLAKTDPGRQQHFCGVIFRLTTISRKSGKSYKSFKQLDCHFRNGWLNDEIEWGPFLKQQIPGSRVLYGWRNMVDEVR